MVLGRKVLKKDPGNPLPAAADGVPAGRYIRVIDGKDQVVVVSDPLANAEAQPGRWLDKDFAKIDRVKTVTVANDSGGWKITRDVEWGSGNSRARRRPRRKRRGRAVNALGQLRQRRCGRPKPENDGKPVTVSAETFETSPIRSRSQGKTATHTLSACGRREPPNTARWRKAKSPKTRTPRQGFR